MSRPTINDVARAAGVSKGAGVAPVTRQRILDVAQELGWTPSARARALSASRAFAVGLVIMRPPETLRSDQFFISFISGLEVVLSEQGIALLLQVVPDRDREHQSYRRLADEGRVDGVFVTDLFVDDTRPALLAEIRLPAVIIGPAQGDGYWPAVGIDDAPGITAAVDHLISLGHTRIAHVAGPGYMVHGRSRRQAWSTALEQSGLPEGPCIEADFSAESGAAATRELLDHRVRRHRDRRSPAATPDHRDERRHHLGSSRSHPAARACPRAGTHSDRPSTSSAGCPRLDGTCSPVVTTTPPQ